MPPQNFSCEFKGVSSGKYAVRIGCSIPKKNTPDEVFGLLVGSKVSVELWASENEEDARGQTALKDGGPTGESLEVEGEVKGVAMFVDHYSFALVIHKDTVEIKDLDWFGFRKGQVSIERLGDGSGREKPKKAKAGAK